MSGGLIEQMAADAKKLRIRGKQTSEMAEAVKKKQPRKLQQLVAFMMAHGQSIEQISDKTELSIDEITDMRASKDFKHILVTEARKVGPEAVQRIFTGAMAEAALGIINVAAMAEGKIKLDACKQILDRTTGTPLAGKALDMGGESELPDDPVKASQQLDEEIDRCRQQLGYSPVRGVDDAGAD
ncbi:MAG: hypothetical protein CMP14_00270 [Rickettsiales bacterium]|nr:hypothetical protein [Rickettsiales bacterium]|tara:strand:+ start:290 stop:841 length:552 start_codon:yes stop_codon:yes gene_type:complete